ncbi:hypothetical protein CARUB_v10021213mg [Capsella rubella]|uniref:Uncharacterized protein n=1 Tax=Capsella rubella TaxID=81985 RepID=R0GJ97_9BRAS|nr:hypothetical protein CARUB_v10021213mg [Capsella rubella]
MVLESFLQYKAHHHHHHHHHHHPHHHRNSSIAEKPNHQVMEYEDMTRDVMKASAHHMRKVKSERMAKDEDIDKEAEIFINLKHRKFSNCI